MSDSRVNRKKRVSKQNISDFFCKKFRLLTPKYILEYEFVEFGHTQKKSSFFIFIFLEPNISANVLSTLLQNQLSESASYRKNVYYSSGDSIRTKNSAEKE